jgi:alkyl hydroperoxide reductase subunit D
LLTTYTIKGKFDKILSMINKTFRKIAILIEELPPYAADIKDSLNNIILAENEHLSANDVLGVALTVGYALKNESLLKYIRSDAKKVLSDEEAHACKIAASTISMTSIYNYFIRQKIHKDLSKIPADLSLENLEKHGIDQNEFNMYCLAAAIVNKSPECIEKYSHKLLKAKISTESIIKITSIVSVLCAVSTALEINRIRSFEFLSREENI